ncbi:MAG: CocE/NonD family hydrolase [Methyloligellaceae bacterium]
MTDDPRQSAAWTLDPATYLEQRPPTHGVPERPFSRYLEMPDGVRLAVDVHVPEGERPPAGFPAVLIFTPYYRRFALTPDAPAGTEACPNAGAYRDAFVPRGYATVIVDVRGTGASFGTRDSFRSPVERNDYAAVMDWVAAQDWCDGQLGATGISYVGAACDFAASTGHPALKAIAPISAVWDTYADHFYPGGILLTHLAGAYNELMMALDLDQRELLKRYVYYADPHLAGPAPVDEDADGALVRDAIAEHAANVAMPDFIREFQFRGDALAYDPAFTSDSFSPHAYSAGVDPDLAVLSLSGWYDGSYMNGSISRFLSLPNRHRHLLLGPWDHGARSNGSPFRAAVAPQFPIYGEILRFFDTYVRGDQTGLADEAPVHYFTMGEEAWKTAEQWPPTEASRTLFLGDQGRLTETPDGEGADRYDVDFGVGTGRDTRYGRLAALNIQDYYPSWGDREGRILRYACEPLAEDLTLTGHPVLTLHFSSDQRDACVFAYLEDEAPDGTVRYVTEGMLRALHRKETEASQTYRTSWPYRSYTRSDAAPLTPGEPATLRFALLATSWRFKAGHRLRLAITGADRDNFSRLPHGRPGQWQIFRGGGKPSAIVLPFEGTD